MSVVPPLAPGRHVCGVATTPESHVDLAAGWIAESLDAGMQTVWVASSGREVLERLEREGVAWETAVLDGRLLFRRPEHVVGLSGAHEVNDRLRAALELTDRALGSGYAGVSVGVDCTAALAVMPDAQTQLAFEKAWERFTRQHPLSLMCLYPPSLERDHVAQAIAAHPREYADATASARLLDGRVFVRGEIDALNSETLRTFLEAATQEARQHHGGVVLDLAGLAFVDVAGVRQLMELTAAGAPGSVRITRAPSVLRRVAELTGWSERLGLGLAEDAA